MPPGWCDRTSVPAGRVDIMAGVPAGLVTADEVNVQPAPTKGNSLDNASTWSMIWFIASLVYLLGIYYGMINVSQRG